MFASVRWPDRLIPADCDFVGPDGLRNKDGSWSGTLTALETTKELPLMQAGTPGIHRYDVKVNEMPMGSVAIYDILSSDKTTLALFIAAIGAAAAVIGAVIGTVLQGPFSSLRGNTPPASTPTPIVVTLVLATPVPVVVGQPVPLADPAPSSSVQITPLASGG